MDICRRAGVKNIKLTNLPEPSAEDLKWKKISDKSLEREKLESELSPEELKNLPDEEIDIF